MTDSVDAGIPVRLAEALAGRYELVREVGQGGMATVYLARDLRHDREVALKVLRPELGALIGAERFLQEIRLTARLQHPHILPLHDSGEAGGLLWYVMPYVQGESLRQRLQREKQLPIGEAVRIATEVASALDYAHRHGVIHRDIKPENVLLHDGQALVADFGIALAVRAAGGHRLTETGLSLGTPHYMSPEQAMGDRALDARSDIYSLGSLLYEMLAGEPPYTGPTSQAIVAKLLTEPAPVLTARRDTVPPHVAAAVHVALAKLPADRHASARDFADALNRPGSAAIAGAFVPTAVTGAAPARPARYDLRLFALGVTALAFAGVAGWALLRPAPPPAVLRFELAHPPFRDLIGPDVVLSPDGQGYVYVFRPAGSGSFQLYYQRLEQGEPTTLPSTENAWQVTFSPDGVVVGFATLSGVPAAAFRTPVDGGASQRVADSIDPSGNLAWLPDGGLLFTHSRTGGIAIAPSGDSPARLITSPDTLAGVTHGRVSLLPSGKQALFVISRSNSLEGSEVAAVDLSSGRIKVLTRGIWAQYAKTGHLVVVLADGTVMAMPFDPRRLEIRGPGRAILSGVSVDSDGFPEFSLAENGTLIYGTGRNVVDLVTVDRAGRERTLTEEARLFDDPALSPDGRRIVVTLGEDVWTYSLGDGTLSRLTFDPGVDFPTFTPDGKSVMFSRRAGDYRGVGIKAVDGGGSERRLATPPGRSQGIALTPDGRTMVLNVVAENGEDLFVFTAGVDSVPRPFVTSRFDERSPALSPDGRWLAYSSDESGEREVYVRPFPGVGGRWQVSTGGGAEPAWAHNGRELFYRTAAGLVAAQLRLSPSVEVVSRTVLFSDAPYERSTWHREYDVFPGDREFLFVRARSEGRRLFLVLNWLEELKRGGPL